LKQYVDSLPPELKNTYIVVMGKNIVVKRSELYEYCLKNPDFAYTYAKVLAILNER
jgi:ApbE superfamily uncharacterized protein (UPF0280 family)